MLFEPVRTEFVFQHGADRLAGDLVLPPWPGPYPAVVLVWGSGPGGRDPGPWAARFAGAGMACLAYDKPGCGQSTGDWHGQSLADRAAETVAAVHALKRRSDISRVALVGGSQGGWVAPLAATMDDAVSAVVTVSGPGVSALAQEQFRLRTQLPAQGG